MGKTLVIFDIDGTLVYSNKIDSQCFAEVYETMYRRPFPTIDWTQYPHVTDTTIFRTVVRQHFGRTTEEAEMQEFQHHFVALLESRRKSNPEEFREVPHARRAVERLQDDERFVVAIGTGGWIRPAKVKLRHVQILTESLVLVGADGHEQRQGIIGQVMETVAATEKIDRTVYVGDAIWDVHTTRRMNMNFVGIRRNGDFEVLEKEGTRVVLQDYADYDRFVEALFQAEPPKIL
ncbi:MAG: HAD family hydrolase [Bacteroidetes bacterium]|nr:HAD family hydrolase [Bacteroidota bacterium]